MKKFLICAGLLCLGASVLSAADLTTTVTTESSQNYNKAYRDIGETNTLVYDGVRASTFSVLIAGANRVKTGEGILERLIIPTPCAGTTNYIVADAAAAAAAGYAIVISTLSSTTAVNSVVEYGLRFNTGLAINVAYSSCPVTVIYR